MEKYAIGLDLGTSSVKAVLFSKQSGVVAKDSEAFVYASAYLPDGSEYLGIDMENFYGKICTVLRRLAKFIPNGAEFAGLAMASASGNSVICDADGNAIIDGYSWLNRAFDDETASVFGKDFGPEVREAAGWSFVSSFPLGQLSHLRLHAPDLLDNAATVCMSTEYVLHRLTGRWGVDVSTATPFYLLDQKKRGWNKDFLERLGIPESKLPPLYESGELLGSITEAAERDTGLPFGSRVYLGSFDHPTAARACNVQKQGDLLISCGTSWVCFFPMDKRENIVSGKVLADPFLTPDGPWGAMFSLTRASEKINEVVEKYIDTSKDKFLTLDKLAASAPSGAGGLSINPREDIPDLSAYPKENVARALMEGIANALKQRIADFIKVERITMCGGPSSSPVWREVLSEIFGAPVSVTYGAHSGAVGAALYALK
ncbi:MAG: hypothetical protein E7612_10635 [Ruminococcaceae bacterium]|nr:hypothetical protein [Oscillospiraceae bacterium]